MKYRRGIFRSLLSAVLAMAVALTSAPLTVHGEELKVSPEVSIRFKQGEKLPDRQGVPAILEAELSGGGAAEVSIRLDAAETGALRSSEDETKTLSDGAALGSGAGMTLRFAPDGSGSLDFTLDEDQTAAKAELWLLAAGEEQISFDITESDVTITASGERAAILRTRRRQRAKKSPVLTAKRRPARTKTQRFRTGTDRRRAI